MNRLHKNILLTAVLASVPLTLYAQVYNGTALQISGTGYVGGSHTITSSPVFAVGYNHLLSSSTGSAAIGYSLQAYGSNSILVVGEYNTNLPGAYLVVGNGFYGSINGGTPTVTRRNAFEVTSGGNVNVPLEATSSKVTIGKTTTASATVTTKIYGTADIDRVLPKGGILMGDYQN